METFDPSNLDPKKFYNISLIAKYLDTSTTSLLAFLRNSNILHTAWENKNLPNHKYLAWFKIERDEKNEIILYLNANGVKQLILFLLDSAIILPYKQAVILRQQLR